MAQNNNEISEVSATVRIDESGVEAKAKSRFISGLDRLGGNVAEWANVRMEEATAPRRHRLIVEKTIVEAATDAIVEEIGQDADFAREIIQSTMSQHSRRQANKEGVAKVALKQLKLNPPTAEQQNSGPEQLFPEFLDRFERYAEDATTDQLKEKWASVLAAEVRKPGVADNRVMRIIDEVDSTTAAKFSEMVRHRVGFCVPRCLFDLDLETKNNFVSYDLIDQTEIGIVRASQEVMTRDGRELFFIGFGDYAICVPKENLQQDFHKFGKKEVFVWNSNGPSVPIISLTSSGQRLMDLMPDHSNSNIKKLLALVSQGDERFLLYKLDPKTGDYSEEPI